MDPRHWIDIVGAITDERVELNIFLFFLFFLFLFLFFFFFFFFLLCFVFHLLYLFHFCCCCFRCCCCCCPFKVNRRAVDSGTREPRLLANSWGISRFVWGRSFKGFFEIPYWKIDTPGLFFARVCRIHRFFTMLQTSEKSSVGFFQDSSEILIEFFESPYNVASDVCWFERCFEDSCQRIPFSPTTASIQFIQRTHPLASLNWFILLAKVNRYRAGH